MSSRIQPDPFGQGTGVSHKNSNTNHTRGLTLLMMVKFDILVPMIQVNCAPDECISGINEML